MSEPQILAFPELELGGTTLNFSAPILMGVLNLTPDSFSDGGTLVSTKAALTQAHRLIEAGAQILDVGGESSRPGALSVSADLEMERVLPIIEAIQCEQLPIAISIDTYKASVAREAIARGATIINDITALGDPEMATVAAETGAALILMHMRGTPETMQEGPIEYPDLFDEIVGFLSEAIEQATEAGVPRNRILVDPGIGFGKTLEHNLALTRHIGKLNVLECPIVYGPSRKRFLGTITGREVGDRDRATAAACTAAVLFGAHVMRIHDAEAVRDAVDVASALRTIT